MQISPRRRQRALKVHELRQRGNSLRNIGKRLGISHTTALDDLKLIETHWSEFTRQSTDDFQLEQLGLMQRRLRMLLRRDLLKAFGKLSPTDFVRIHEAHSQELAILLRETRRLAAQLRERADLRDAESGELPPQLDFPEEELVSALKSTKPAKSTPSASSARAARAGEPTNANHGLPKSSKPDRSNHPVPRKSLEIPTPPARENISNQPPTSATPEQLNREAETFLRNYNRTELQPTAGGG